MDLYLEEACDFRCLSGTRVRNANLLLAPCTSVNLYARMTALSGARSSVYSVSCVFPRTLNNPGEDAGHAQGEPKSLTGLSYRILRFCRSVKSERWRMLPAAFSRPSPWGKSEEKRI